MKSTYRFTGSAKRIVALCACLLCSGFLNAAQYEVSLPHYEANAGQTLRVPILLNDATDLAHLRVQINYDEQVATFVQLLEGDLGTLFDLELTLESGSFIIDGTRAEALTTGGGTLAWVDFLLNPGATADAYTDLAIAEFDAGDASGVTDLAATNALNVVHGSITLILNPNIDNSGNRLPDWWEQSHGLDPYAVQPEQDVEGDGLNLLQEYAFGGNPWINDAASLRGNSYFNASDYFVFTFRRRNDDVSLNYKLWESDDLQGWNLVEQVTRSAGPVVNLGDGIEEVSIRSLLPVTDLAAPAKLFMRLEVER
jgi:hypothetical protein